MKKDFTCILTTTINVPYFLENLFKNIKKFKHKNTYVVVIADKKTPIAAKHYCRKVSKKFDIRVDYLDVSFQKKYFRNHKRILNLFPYNDALRRLLGSIYLLKQNPVPERLIFVDDDNYIFNKVDFIKKHSIVGNILDTKVVKNKSKFPNIYKYLITDEKLPLFPRGFPWSKRNKESFKFQSNLKQKGKVLANCGFIIGDPDIDAVSRLFWKVDIKKIGTNKNFYIGKNNYFPFNDQNTAISKELFKIYFKPLSAGRNSDIWTSYLICKLSHIHNDLVSYGQPHLKQIRNIHDNWKDYELEKKHNMSTDLFIKIIENIKIKKQKNYFSTFYNLIRKCLNETNRNIIKISKIKKENKTRHYQSISSFEIKERNISNLKYIKNYFKGYITWLDEIRKIN
jgi:hypothetical protein